MQKKNSIMLHSENEITDANRIIYTPSFFAKSTLFYLQEMGSLKSLKPHKHSRSDLHSYLFMIVLNGAGIFNYGDNSYQLVRGDIVFIDCRTAYSHESSLDNPWELMWIHFNGLNMERYYMYFQNKFQTSIIQAADYMDFIVLHDQLMELANEKNIDTELEISSKLYQIITRLLVLQNIEIGDKKSEKIETVKNYIDEHYEQRIFLDVLADKFFISKYHLAREFKKVYGTSIVQYVNYCRVTKSKELLRYSRLRINEIAASVGIYDNNYFNKLFQKLEGVTPGEYRKQWRGE